MIDGGRGEWRPQRVARGRQLGAAARQAAPGSRAVRLWALTTRAGRITIIELARRDRNSLAGRPGWPELIGLAAFGSRRAALFSARLFARRLFALAAQTCSRAR